MHAKHQEKSNFRLYLWAWKKSLSKFYLSRIFRNEKLSGKIDVPKNFHNFDQINVWLTPGFRIFQIGPP